MSLTALDALHKLHFIPMCNIAKCTVIYFGVRTGCRWNRAERLYSYNPNPNPNPNPKLTSHPSMSHPHRRQWQWHFAEERRITILTISVARLSHTRMHGEE